MRIVIIISWSVFEKDDWFFVKHFCVSLISLHVLKERYMIFDFAFSIHNIMRFTDIWKLIDVTVVVLESNLILLSWIYAVWIIRSRRCFALTLFMFCSLLLMNLNLQW